MPSLDPAKVKSKRAFPHATTFYGLAATPDGSRLFAGSDDYALYAFDVSSEKKEPAARWTGHDNYVSALAYLPRTEKPLLISGSYDHQLIWWDPATGRSLRTVPAHEGWVRDLTAFPDGSRLASAGDDLVVKTWDAESGKLIRTFSGHAKQTPQGHATALYAVAVSPDGKFVAGGDRIGEVRVWENDTGKLAARFQVPVLYTYDPRQRKRSIGGIRSLAFSAEGNLLAIGGIGQVGNVDGLAGPATVEVWDWRKPAHRATGTAEGHKGILNGLIFHPEGWLIGVGGGGDNGFLAFWKTDSLPEDKKTDLAGRRIKTDGHLHRLALNAAATELYVAGHRKVEAWEWTG
jgi:WD40 repeat protein